MAKLHESRQQKGLPSSEGFFLKTKQNQKTMAWDCLGRRDPKTLAGHTTVRLWS